MNFTMMKVALVLRFEPMYIFLSVWFIREYPYLVPFPIFWQMDQN